MNSLPLGFVFDKSKNKNLNQSLLDDTSSSADDNIGFAASEEAAGWDSPGSSTPQTTSPLAAGAFASNSIFGAGLFAQPIYGPANGLSAAVAPAAQFTQVRVGVAGGVTFNLEFVNADKPTAAFESGVEQAATLLSQALHNNITVNLEIGYGELFGQQIQTGWGEGGPTSLQDESYSTVRSDLIAEKSLGDPNLGDFTHLPSGSSAYGYSDVLLATAQAKALGLESATDAALDGGAGFGIGTNSSELVGLALHELTHAMGRAPQPGTPDLFDLWRFTSAGHILVSDAIPSAAAYFSVNGGATSLANYGIDSDPSDFLGSSVLNDPFDEMVSDTSQTLTALDLTQLDVLGFNTFVPHILPTVDVRDFAVSANRAASESAFLTGVTSPSGDAITEYRFLDAGGDGGHLAVNGAAQADSRWVVVSASGLGGVSYVGGAQVGDDTLYVEAYDGTINTWSAYGEVTAATHAGATVNVQNVAADANLPVSATSWVTGVTNPSGDSLTYYRFADGGGDYGHLALNGVAEADGKWIMVSAAALSSLTYVGAPFVGSESLYVEAYDATTKSWTSYSQLTASTYAKPAVDVQNVSVTARHSVSESAFFTGLTNPNADSVTEYRFADAGGDNGHLALNGVSQADRHWIVASAAQLSNVTYVGGPKAGSESLYVDAFDATTNAWTAYVGLTAKTVAA